MHNCLIVDHSSTARVILKQKLSSMNVNVQEASTTVEALGLLKSSSYDLAAVDLDGSSEAAISFIKDCRKDLLNARTIFICTSALASLHEIEVLLSNGFSDILCKPYSDNKIQNQLARYGIFNQ